MYMYLAPGEAFEHTHITASTTMLIEGDVTLDVEGTRAGLTRGTPVAIDANTSHIVINTGRGPAIVECVHKRVL